MKKSVATRLRHRPSGGSGDPLPTGKRLWLLGGFLGAGKTTCLGAAVKWLHRRGLRPGVVTNDQGMGLVDTELGREFMATGGSGKASAVRQVTGGCFCCRADALVEALQELEAESRPDVFLVEPVGSCTDLMATVMLPLRDIYKADFALAPMSVVVDGRRFQGSGGGVRKGGVGRKSTRTAPRVTGFSKGVDYIFRKQLEEAEILVLNKVDAMTAGQRRSARKRLAEEFGGKRVIEVSARTSEGMEEWFEMLMRETSAPKALMEVDYDVYAEGEALLGWHNAELSAHAMGDDFDGNKLLQGLARSIQAELERQKIELAHFKMSLRSVAMGGTRIGSADGLAVVNAVQNGQKAELSRKMEGRAVVGELLVNLRAEGDPAILARVVAMELNKPRSDVRLVWKERAAFRPGRPQPTHRITRLEAE